MTRTTKSALLTIAEARTRLHVSDWKMRQLIATRAVAAARVGWRWLIDPDDLETYINRQKTVATSARTAPVPVSPVDEDGIVDADTLFPEAQEGANPFL